MRVSVMDKATICGRLLVDERVEAFDRPCLALGHNDSFLQVDGGSFQTKKRVYSFLMN
jgi:hypothetical protein